MGSADSVIERASPSRTPTADCPSIRPWYFEVIYIIEVSRAAITLGYSSGASKGDSYLCFAGGYTERHGGLGQPIIALSL